jgi:hypothetical protein
MAEPDDHGVPEVADAVGVGAQVLVVGARRDGRDRGVGRADLHERDDAMLAEGLRERHVKRLSPAAVVAEEVRRPARHLPEARHRGIAGRGPGLEGAQVGG